MYEFEATIREMIEAALRRQGVQPLYLGGVSASGGGAGGPAGGFIGMLPQTAIAYDMSELADDTIPPSGTLLDNLNHIRYMIANVSGGGGGGHTVQDEGTPLTQRTNLNFVGTIVSVTDDPGNNATVVTISSPTVPTKATGADLDTGTDDAKFATSLALKDSHNVPSVIPGTSGNIMTSDGTDWESKPLGAVVSGMGGAPGFQTLTPGTNIDWNLSGGSARVTVSGEMTMNPPTNLGIGEHYFLSVVQHADVGGNTLLWDDAFKFADNTPPTLSTYKGREDIIPFESDGTYLYGMGIIRNLTNVAPSLEYLTNLVLWFKADDEAYSDDGVTLCSNNDTVYRWGDNSGNDFDAVQATSGARPTFKTNVIGTKPAVRFDGSDDVLPIPSDLAGTGDNLSFFIVIVPHDTTPIGIFDSGDEDSIRNYNSGQWDWFSGAPYVSMDLADTNPVILEFIHTLAPERNVDYYKNGTFVSSNPAADSSTTLWETYAAIGSINLGYTFYDGDIAEFILYKEAVGTTTRQDIEVYLKQKYGIG